MCPKKKKKQKHKRSSVFNKPYFDVEKDFRVAFQHYEHGQYPIAEKICSRIISRVSNHLPSINLLATIAGETGDLERSVALFREAIKKDSYNPLYHYNLGFIFQRQGKLNDAIICYEEAIRLNPSIAGAYYNAGIAFLQKGQLEEAVSRFQKTVELHPGYAEAFHNLGIAYSKQKKHLESIKNFKKVLDIVPYHDVACRHLARELQKTCNWKELKPIMDKLDGLTKGALQKGMRPGEHPFFNLTRSDDPSLNLAVARSWAIDINKRVRDISSQFDFENRKSPDKKITIGYISNNYRNHPLGHIMCTFFELHDRENFKIICYSSGIDDGSSYRKKIEKGCDIFTDIQKRHFIDIANQIYEDKVDILVDLMGHTRGNNLEACALRPAPVQVRYMDFPGSSGADFFDYLVTDRIVSPENHSDYYSENLVYLPHSYYVYDYQQSISEVAYKKRDFELPDDSFVFCSFNDSYKFDIETFDVWMSILRNIPTGVLWLWKTNEYAIGNLKMEAERRNVDPCRLIFSGSLPKDKHLARLKLADLALDTRVVNGHTTTCDALWAGVPVITLLGKHFMSRVSASVLTALGLEGLITTNFEEYRKLAESLAQDTEKLRNVREDLQKKRFTEPLFDTPRFVKNIETAYREMWHIFLAGKSPRKIEIVEN